LALDDTNKIAITKNRKPCWQLKYVANHTTRQRIHRFFQTEAKADDETAICAERETSCGEF